MSQSLETEVDLSPDISRVVTEDDTPVDNLFSETQQRLLCDCLYSSWSPLDGPQVFLAAVNVGVFYAVHQPPLVPDVLLSLEVQAPQDWREKKNRAYFTWEFGKPPDVVIEIVSNREGNELGSKLRDYARIRVSYYIVFDPLQQLGETLMRVYELQGNSYEEMSQTWLEKVGLGLALWEGEFESKQATWLRWCDQQGKVVPTGAERAEQEHQRAEQFAQQLRALGINPEDLPR